MESNKNASGALLLLVIMVIGIGVLIFLAVSVIGLNFSLGEKVNLPIVDLSGFLRLSLLVIVSAVVSQLLAFFVARRLEKFVFPFFDRRWLPKVGKAENYSTRHGERLERVVTPDFFATTLWELLTETAFPLFFWSAFLGIAAVISARSFHLWGIGTAFAVVLIVNLLVFSFQYWVKEWRRKHLKFVVFTFMTFYVKVRTPILSLLFSLGTLTKVSGTPMKQIQEVQIAADPQDFDEKYQTTWIRDQYTSILAKRRNVRTLFLRSIFNRAEDTLLWVENGPGLNALLKRLIENAAQDALERDLIDTTAVKLRIGAPDETAWSRNRAEQEAQLYHERFRQVSNGIRSFDLFRIEDPGLYDQNGDPILSPDAAEVEIQSEWPKDVSKFFESQPLTVSAEDSTTTEVNNEDFLE